MSNSDVQQLATGWCPIIAISGSVVRDRDKLEKICCEQYCDVAKPSAPFQHLFRGCSAAALGFVLMDGLDVLHRHAFWADLHISKAIEYGEQSILHGSRRC